ncbi:cytochrome c biogenesis CcdA family protein [Ornithinimicrobium panacihumi]|uniref:cytochrome c biogenesis CcdA family protein n=1 Tax=Ornithinimicrobium panacihumi TaxID=2008449 RepID=UPI003F89548B
MVSISWLAALLAGALSLLSPCSALLLPSFFAYAFGSTRALVARTIVFTVGLMTTLVPLGMGVQAVSRALFLHRETVITVAGWVVIALGVLTIVLGGRSMPGTSRLRAQTPGLTARSRARDAMSWVATWALGAVFGLAGFCAGPALGAILTMAATSPSAWVGGVLLALYAVGMAVPLFALAWGWDRFDLGSRPWVRGRMITLGPVSRHSTTLLSGLLFILVGVIFLAFDGTAGLLAGPDLTRFEGQAQAWLMDTFSGVPWWSLPAAVAVVALLVTLRRSTKV